MLHLLLPLLALQEPVDENVAPPRSRGASAPIHSEAELALSDESVWLAYRTPLSAGDGHFTAGLHANDNDDYLLTARLMRYGELEELPLTLGAGFAGYALFLDDPGDEEVYALALTGSAGYQLPLSLPTTASLEVAYAPDITTFHDGEGLFDLSLRVEVELSEYSAVFLGYRFIETELEESPDHELDDNVHVGIRLTL